MLTSTSNNPLLGITGPELVEEYHRRKLGQLSDQHLVALAAGIIGVPRAEIPADRYSFVLHAPLELIARSALLPYVEAARHEEARLRIASLAVGYEASGPPLSTPPTHDFDSLDDAATALVAGIDGENLDDVDIAASWLGPRVRADQLVAILADHTIDRLSAAGHGNIYLALLARNQPRGLPQQMLRHPAREIAKRSSRRINLPPTRARSDPGVTTGLLESLVRIPFSGLAEQSGIASMVEYAQDSGALSGLVDSDGAFTASYGPPFEILRFAAYAMLQGSIEVAAYGWTHCLTLAQAALMVAPACSDPSEAIYVASAYLASYWATLGQETLDLGLSLSPPVDANLATSLEAEPLQAAAAAWHGPALEDTLTVLATSAACAHDAHRVKYTLACFDAAVADPSHAQLYLAAAAYLNAWWVQHPDRSDPFTDVAT